jgi:hypothetical protein
MPASFLLIAELLMKHPEALSKLPPPTKTNAQVVNTAKLNESLVDISKEILKCYHKTANFKQVDIIGGQFARQSQYGATHSMGIRISYIGAITSNPYEITVAVMVKQEHVRTAVISDNAKIHYNRKCQLEDWVSTSQTRQLSDAK